MAEQEVVGKERVQVFISTEVENARKRYAEEVLGPRVTAKSSMYQQAMVEFLKLRGYWPNNTTQNSV